ncbi:MAG: hypothetical protein Q9226_000920 [Calogaya cf. arnoldii]
MDLKEASVQLASPGQIHRVGLPMPSHLGDLDKLPLELRRMIWESLLRFPRPVYLQTPENLSSHGHHERICHINFHRSVGDTIYCTNHFNPADIIAHKAPRSVLEISLTSKALRAEVLTEFFALNSILVTFPDRLLRFESEASHYFTRIESLTLCWCKQPVLCSINGIRALQRMPALEKLAIVIHYNEAILNRGGNLRAARGMTQLSELRGIKELKLVGTDRKRDAEGNWQDIDVMDSAAVGPWLREQVTRPKPGPDQ